MQLCQPGLAFIRQVERVQPLVGAFLAAFDQAAVFQRIDQLRQCGFPQNDQMCKFFLCQARVDVDQVQDCNFATRNLMVREEPLVPGLDPRAQYPRDE